MFKDKSKLLLLGALAVLVFTLSNGNFFSHGIGFYGFHGFPKILLIAFVVWMLCGCRGSRCCRHSSCGPDDSGNDADGEIESDGGTEAEVGANADETTEESEKN